MEQRDQNFEIKAQQLQSAYDALCKWANYEDKYPEELTLTSRFVKLMKDNDYEAVHDVFTGDITEIWFVGDRLGNDYEMFKAIAPYVEHGSFIEFVGEGGTLWRWVFKQGEMREILGKIVWEDTEL